MASCKKPDINRNVNKILEANIKNFDEFPKTLDMGKISIPIDNLEKVTKKLENVNLEENLPIKREIRLEKKNLDVNENVFAIGKKKILVESSNFGPTLEDRKRGINISPDGIDIVDNFRFISGRYWTLDDTGKSLIFLNKKIEGTPWSVQDFNFSRNGILKPADQKVLLNNEIVSGSNNLGTANSFVTQQWVSIKANSPYYTLLDDNGISFSGISGVSNKSLTQASSQSGKINTSNLKFNENLFKQNITGNKILVTDPKILEEFKLEQSGFQTKNIFQLDPELKKDIKLIQPSSITPILEKLIEPAIKQGVDFFDHSFEIPIPLTNKELKKYNGFIKPLSSKVECNYNFFIDKYESAISKLNITDKILPNFYVMMSELINGTNNGDFINHITLGGKINFSDVFSPRTPKNKEKENKSIKKFVGEYFEIYSNQLNSIVDDVNFRNILLNLEGKYTNLLISSDNISLIKDLSDRRFLFPMFNQIEFSTDTTTILTNLLKESRYTTIIQKNILRDILSNIAKKTKFLETSELDRGIDGKFIKDFSYEIIDRNIWDISDLTKSDNLNMVNNFSIFLGENNLEEKTSNTNNFFKNLFNVIFGGKLRKIIKQKMRTFEELMSGKLAYSETIMYRVEKLEINSDGTNGKVIQNFIFPNFSELDMINFIDTQVKYNKKYSYQVYAYQAVIGTKYNYSNVEVKGKFATFLVTQYPSVKIVEIPYAFIKSHILDNPPISPDINFVPYKGVDDKILILFNSNVGDILQDPIAIEQKDNDIFKLYRESKDLEKNEKIRFKTDDHSGVFQIFRLENKPTKYSDFEGSLIAAVETDISKISLQSATSATFIDSIDSNRKYYYTFRVVDIHGNISNPTPVFQFEMINQEGVIYPLLEMIDFDKEQKENKNITKSFKKYIKISPAFSQELINEEKGNIKNLKSAKDVREVFLGIREEQTWGKKFKIRFVSKNTGKKLDLNLDFTNKLLNRIEEKDQK